MAGAVFLLRVLSTWRPIPGIPINVRSIRMQTPTPWLCCLPSSVVCCSVWFRFVRSCAPIPGRSSARALQASAPSTALRCEMCCWARKSPSARFWSPPRWSRCVAWLARCRVVMASSHRERCSSGPICTWPAMTGISGPRCSSACSIARRPFRRDGRGFMPTACRSASAAVTLPFSPTAPQIFGPRTLSLMRSTSTSHRIISVPPERPFLPVDRLRCTMRAKTPLVAVVNREFVRKVLGSTNNAVGSHFKVWGGTRAEIIGVVEDGKYQP